MNVPGLSFDNITFPERKSIVRSDTHLENIVEEAKKVDLTKVNFEGEDFHPQTKIIQKQKVYFWIRLYIKDEIDIKPETKINMVYNSGQETLETHFMYFGKKGFERDTQGQIVNFNPEDDKKVLCLLIDSENININSNNIPYMRTLFPLGKFFQPQYIRKYDFTFDLEDGTQIDFFNIVF
jgi:hypothetical protein